MAVVTLPVVTTPSGAHLVDVNGNPISSLDGGFPTVDRIRSLIMAGQGFAATTGILATVTTSGVYIALGLLASAITKNVYIYRISATPQNVTGDMRITQASSLDATLTAAITPLNSNLGSSNTSLATVKSTPNSNSTPTATSGTTRQQWGSSANFGSNQEMLQNGAGIFIPAGATQGITVWMKIPTAANTGQANMEWIEF